MALINCHECGAQVSTEAKACPGCGAKPKKSHAIQLLFVLVGLVAMLVIFGQFVPSTKDRATVQTAEPVLAQKAPIDASAARALVDPKVYVGTNAQVVSAVNLTGYYAADMLNADAFFQGQRIRVGGTVGSFVCLDTVGILDTGRMRLLMFDSPYANTHAAMDFAEDGHHPTISDDEFKSAARVGAVVVASCIVKPLDAGNFKWKVADVTLHECKLESVSDSESPLSAKALSQNAPHGCEFHPGPRPDRLWLPSASALASQAGQSAARRDPAIAELDLPPLPPPVRLQDGAPAKLSGIYGSGTFDNCCEGGVSKREQFDALRLDRTIILHDLDPATATAVNENLIGTVQLGGMTDEQRAKIAKGQRIAVSCSSLDESVSGHVALQAYCVNARVTLLP